MSHLSVQRESSVRIHHEKFLEDTGKRLLHLAYAKRQRDDNRVAQLN